MTQTPDSNRIDRLEEDMQAVKELLSSSAAIADRNTQAINLIAGHLDGLAVRFGQLAESQRITQSSIDQLAALMVRFAENAEADRAAIGELQSEVRGIQTENRRILDYLFGQQNERQ
ncbi:hypothetical protein [Argonema antarcticum]|uniref:hypothetical protein n=1 Tax=Argonema antarcticum TaxID=2942763 RepID=UPI002010D19B|nr:hypothetical protein [Argonema antarcticum]MCL1475049.1 hypothetical protein [Argonema antarcticum A004/B2]